VKKLQFLTIECDVYGTKNVSSIVQMFDVLQLTYDYIHNNQSFFFDNFFVLVE
jgi:hypothetical protein